jgi:hypothetical protein
MKTLFVSLAALLFAFFVGCQSSITDPVNQDDFGSTSESNFTNKDLVSTYPGVIKLEGVIDDPSHAFEGCAKIKGIVRYRIDLVDFNAVRPAPHPALKVNLLVKAKIKCQNPADDNLWIVESSSEDLVSKSNVAESIYYLEKSFRVINSPLNLVLKFRINDRTLTLESMKLVKISKYQTAEDSTF